MSNYSTKVQRFGLAKEATRLTVESAPAKWHAIDPSSRLDYVRSLIEDVTLRGKSSRFAPAPGQNVGTGKIAFPVRAQNFGEYLQMLIGDPVSAQQGSTTAYKHTFTPGNTLQLPTYTMFLDRSLNVRKYNGCSISEIAMEIGPDDLLRAVCSMMFVTEASGSIGSPSYSESEELGFQHLAVTLGGSSSLETRSHSLKLSNGMIRKPVLAGSEDAVDFLSIEHKAQGSFVIFFTDTTERDKFLAGSSSSLVLTFTGATIDSPYSYKLVLTFDEIYYKAYAYGESEGLLAAEVSWDAVWNSSNSRLYKAELFNTLTSY